jgi:hypothetical protein
MFERWLRSPSTIIFLFLVVCCFAFGLIQLVLLWPVQFASGEISTVLLKPADSPLLLSADYVPSDECGSFLVPANALWTGLLRCHQVQLTRADIQRQYLNAAWEYESAERATEVTKIAATLPQLNGSDYGVVDAAPQVGVFSITTFATVVAPRGNTYIQNIFWSHKNMFLRLSVISRDQPNIDDLYALASMIESRLP